MQCQPKVQRRDRADLGQRCTSQGLPRSFVPQKLPHPVRLVVPLRQATAHKSAWCELLFAATGDVARRISVSVSRGRFWRRLCGCSMPLG